MHHDPQWSSSYENTFKRDLEDLIDESNTIEPDDNDIVLDSSNYRSIETVICLPAKSA